MKNQTVSRKNINEFWCFWENKTAIEERAIRGVHKAIELLFTNVPKEKVIAIYIKGSFLNREMNEKSDVDIVPIVKDNKTLLKILELQKNKSKEYAPAELLPYSFDEFLSVERYIPDPMKGGPGQFLKQIKFAQLIYGGALDIKNFNIRSDLVELKGLVTALNTKFIPRYNSGEFGFSQIVKCVFWLTYFEYCVIGKSPPPPFHKLDEFVVDKGHIVHEAYQLRLNPTKDETIRKNFIIRLEKYLKSFEDKIK